MNKPVVLVLLGVMSGLLGAGLLFLVTRPPVGEAITLLPPPTIPPLVVQVSGEVVSPGVYNLSPGSRVADAVDMAGGMTENADPQALNLAQVVADGMHIHVPGPTIETQELPLDVVSRSNDALAGLININTANQDELESLPEIGPHLAQAIISYRETNGPFTMVDELLDVSGIGPATLDAIREFITIEDLP